MGEEAVERLTTAMGKRRWSPRQRRWGRDGGALDSGNGEETRKARSRGKPGAVPGCAARACATAGEAEGYRGASSGLCQSTEERGRLGAVLLLWLATLGLIVLPVTLSSSSWGGSCCPPHSQAHSWAGRAGRHALSAYASASAQS
eukprot:353800-Chlamydomonas_euryale.AAC.6